MSKQTQRLEAARHDGYAHALKARGQFYNRYENFASSYRTAFKRGYVQGFKERLTKEPLLRQWFVNNIDLAPTFGMSHRQAEVLHSEIKARYSL